MRTGCPRSRFIMIDLERLKRKFAELYANENPRLFRAPGRVNLIGEHTDYNGGFVLPMAIEFETVVAISARDDRRVKVHTANFDESAEFDLNENAEIEKGSWLNFVEGVARIFERETNVKLPGANILIRSDIPSGAGLSSSAALEIAVGLAFGEISNQTIDRAALAKIGQRTEHEFVGARVGIMDQFVSANASENHALLLDCRSLEFEHVPLDTTNAAIVICNTNVKHNLAASEYNTRRAECEQAVEILKRFLPGIEQLRDVSVEDFEKFQDKLPQTIGRRARHVVTEIRRTLEAADALKKKDLSRFGRLMRQSHASLRDDYAVSCEELDLLVDIAEKTTGVLGARMTGGGFGGSTVNLVERKNLDQFKDKISREYLRRTKIEATIFVSDAGNGASEITNAD